MIQGTLANKTVWVKQTEHARAAAVIAEAWDLRHLPVERRALLIEATRRHDAGWEALESRDEPTGGWQTLDFMTLAGDLRVGVWRGGVESAASVHPYAGLLVGLHFQRLSVENGDDTEEERQRQRALAGICDDLRSQTAGQSGGRGAPRSGGAGQPTPGPLRPAATHHDRRSAAPGGGRRRMPLPPRQARRHADDRSLAAHRRDAALALPDRGRRGD